MNVSSLFGSLVRSLVFVFLLNQFLLATSIEWLERFSHPNVNHYSQLLFDTSKYQLFVGARDHLLRLSLHNFHQSPKEVAYWPASEEARRACRVRGQSDELCHNYVQVLLASPAAGDEESDGRQEEIYVCGTNAFRPECNWRKKQNIRAAVETVDGKAKCPFSPHWNTTSLMTSSGDYYYGGRLDSMGSDAAILKDPAASDNFLRTTQMDRKLMNADSSFLTSFETDEFVYFVFRETAVENINCGKSVYSRIGRVCKNDLGSDQNLFTTFVKARLNCSVPGQYPFYFNEIQSAVYLDEEQMLYGVFSTPENSIRGSAVCAFTMSSITQAFDGPFKYQKTFDSFWEEVYDKEAINKFKCDSQDAFSVQPNKYQLMNGAVGAYKGMPLISETIETIAEVVVDKVSTKFGKVDMLFVLTAKNKLRRYVHWNTGKACFVDEVLLNLRRNDSVLSIKLLKDMDSLYIGTVQELLRISLSDCSKYDSRDACLHSNDPYCGWDNSVHKCTTAPAGSTRAKHWYQKEERICFTDKWTPWSDWAECEQRSGGNIFDSCLCRYRNCREFGCNDRQETQVTNCTRHGGWTSWSGWNACDTSCGFGIKNRTRSCTNPSPQFGGRPCHGQKVQKSRCSGPPCVSTTENPIIVKHYLWSEWGQWEHCSAECGGGVHLRRRKCLSDNGECVGCDSEWSLCNKHPCHDVKRSTDWTPWYRVNQSTDFIEERFKFSCKAINLAKNSDLSIHLRKEERMDETTQEIEWTICSTKCGNGYQFKWNGYSYDSRICRTGKDCIAPQSKEFSEGKLVGELSGNSIHSKMVKDNPIRKSVDAGIDEVTNSELSPRNIQVQNWSTASIVSSTFVSLLLGILIGSLVTFIFMRRRYTPVQGQGLGLKLFKNSSDNKTSNAYVSANDFKSNNCANISASASLLSPNLTLSRNGSHILHSYVPAKEATIKRASTIRAKLNSDQNF